MAWLRAFGALVASSSLLLAGCTSLLGDFTYDPNAQANGGSAGGLGADDQGDIVILPTAGLVTTEQGAKATFTIALKRAPTANVTIAFSSSNEAEGLVSPLSVSFTTENFDAPQTVQITGIDDELEDGSQSYTVRTLPATSDDPTYHGLNPVDPQVINVDDDTAGFLVTPLAGLVTSESGAEASFSVVLNHAPTEDVVVGLSSDKPAEGLVSTESLVFTALNWMAPQLVTVTGVDDELADGPQPYHVLTALAVSQDSAYDKLDPADVELTNQDNDTAGVTLMPQVGLVTFESGAMTTFGIALNSPPSKDVTIVLSSDDEAEGTVTPSSVVFTNLNWMAPQVVTVTGVDDERADGNQPFKILTAPAQSEDSGYAGLDGPDAEVINTDNDSPGLTVTPTLGLITAETGSAATFTVNLNSKPSGEVVLDVTSTRTEEGVVSPAMLFFTEENWAAPQVVTVTGVNDEVADGMQTYTVHVTPNPNSQDGAYLALLESDVSLSNTDDDSAGITLTAQPGLTTTEIGGSASFTLALNSQPTADVTIPLTSSDPSEGTVTPAQLVFTRDNYNAPQVVTIKGVNDDMADGNQLYRINTEPALSDDAGYAAMNANNLDVTNQDDDSPGIVVTPSNQTLVTTEAGGTATFTVVLTSQPSAEVNIGVSSSNTAEGTVSLSHLRFTMTNWAAPQSVMVKGVNDDVQDGAQLYRIALAAAVSDDANYRGRDPLDVTLSNTDNDSAGITLGNATNLTTTEGGGKASFTIVLNSKPTANVSLALSSSRTAEGTVSPASVTFTNANWSSPQTVTITGVNDDVADGSQLYRVVTAAATSQDPNYSGKDPADPNVSNTDNDSPGITVTPTTGLTTTEGGGTASFSIVLNSQPTANVVLPLRSSKTAEGTISPSSVTFTAANWSAPRTITLTGVNDDVADGAQPYSIVTDAAMSSDAKYNTWDPPDVAASNTDNDSAGITVSAVSGNTTEAGGTASFTIVLDSEPKANVSIALSSTDTGEGTVSPATVTFTNVNWSAPQRITITGVGDAVADGNQPYQVETAAATSTDAGYQGMDAVDVSLSNVDDDSASITVSTAQGNTSEAGASTTFSIVLNSQPTANVTLPLSSSNTSEGTISVSSVTFSSADWSSPKTISVTGVDDDVADGNQPYSIVVGAATSNDNGYEDMDADDVAVTNVDNDSAGISVTETTGETNEGGGSMTFKVVLNSKPTASVSIPVTSSDTGEGTVSPSNLTFTTNNWSAAQTVTVTGVNDDFADGAQTYTARLGAATSTDPGYDEMDASDVAMSNVDNDSAGIAVSDAAGSTGESGSTTTFSVVLNSQPTASVTIPLSSSDDAEGSLTVTSLTFTTDNWSSAQTVTVHGENDNVADGDQPYKILTGPATSADNGYEDMNADDVDLVNIDNDSASVTVSVADGPTSEAGGSATFTVRLNSQPTAAVSIGISSSNSDEGTLDVSSVDFTTTNWAAPQTITVTGVDDAIADGDQDYEITLAMPTSTDATYAALDPNDVALVNTDDDSAGIQVIPAAGDLSEDGTGTTFGIVLNSQPTAAVVIPLSVSDGSEAELQVTSVTFTPANWMTTRQVTVNGVDDNVEDGPQQLTVLTGDIMSADAGYDGKNPPDVTLTNLDDDSAFIDVDPPTLNETGEADGSPTVKFTVVLTSAPTAPVTIPLLSSAPSEGIITSPASGELVFDDSNWDQAQTVTVTGVQDAGMVDGNASYDIEIGPAESSDGNYDGLDPADVTGLLNIDDDV